MAKSLFTRLLRKYGALPTGLEKRNQMLTQQAQLNVRLERFAVPTAPKKIVVVGGGFAGLATAYYLTLQQHEVTLLEASDRLGGRVFSNRNDFAKGQIIEFGAELIGSNHPQWVDFARKFGLSFNVVTGEDMFEGAKLNEPLVLDNEQISDEEAQILFQHMNFVLDRLTNEAAILGDNWSQPWIIPDAQKFDSISIEQWYVAEVKQMHLNAREEKLLLLALNAEFANNNAVSCNKQSLLGVMSQVQAGGGKLYWSMTEVYRCSMGNDELAVKLAEVIKTTNIRLKSLVNRIDVTDNSVIVYYNASERIYADYVVLAVPLPIWNSIKMDDVIKQRASQTGNALKYVTAVKDRFWIKSGTAPSGLGGMVGMTWEGSDNQVELTGKTYDLSCFAGGPFADEIMKTAPDRVKEFFGPKMESIFKGYSQSFINDNYICWPLNPYVKTGYSFPGISQVCNQIRLLNEPYKRMYFAGEHVCAGFWGYMEGALRSGMLAAERIGQDEGAK